MSEVFEKVAVCGYLSDAEIVVIQVFLVPILIEARAEVIWSKMRQRAKWCCKN